MPVYNNIQFWLYTNTYKVDSKESYLEKYSGIIALRREFSTGGYAPEFIEDWINDRLEHNRIEVKGGLLGFTEEYKRELISRISLM